MTTYYDWFKEFIGEEVELAANELHAAAEADDVGCHPYAEACRAVGFKTLFQIPCFA